VRGNFGIDGGVVDRPSIPNAQSLGLQFHYYLHLQDKKQIYLDALVDRGEVVLVGGLGSEPVADIGSTDDLEHECAILNRAAHGTHVRQRSIGRHRRKRHNSVLWLEADDARERRGDSDRTAAIRSQVQRGHSGCRRNGRSATRSTTRFARIKRVSRYAAPRRVCHALVSQLGAYSHCKWMQRELRDGYLGGGRLAEQDGTGLLEARDARRVLLGQIVGRKCERATEGWLALPQKQVLYRGGHAIEQPTWGRGAKGITIIEGRTLPVRLAPLPTLFRLLGTLAGALVVDQAERVERWVEL